MMPDPQVLMDQQLTKMREFLNEKRSENIADSVILKKRIAPVHSSKPVEYEINQSNLLLNMIKLLSGKLSMDEQKEMDKLITAFKNNLEARTNNGTDSADKAKHDTNTNDTGCTETPVSGSEGDNNEEQNSTYNLW